jgi:hypothetical protein
VPFLAPHVAHTLHLELGDVLALATADQEHGQDLTGMEIDAEHSVAVFSGAECAEIPQGNRYCDHLEEQLLPLSTWGTEHVLGKFSRRGAEPDLWKILNGDQETTVHANPPLPGVHGMVLGPGATLEFETDRDLFIKTNSPVSIGQFMVGSAYPGPENNCSPGIDVSGCALPYESTCRSTERMGDPAFSINVPTRQFRRQYGFLVPAFYQRNHVNILFKQGTGITLDGESLATTGDHVTQIGSTSWLVIRQHTTAGPHRIEADAPIGLYVYGYDCSVSYALPGGLNLTRF